MSNITKDRNYYQATTGDSGFRKLSAGQTTPSGEKYRFIVCLQEANVNVESEVGDSLTGQILPTGMTLFGRFSEVQCYEGVVLAYISE
jgi:hypothetical protein